MSTSSSIKHGFTARPVTHSLVHRCRHFGYMLKANTLRSVSSAVAKWWVSLTRWTGKQIQNGLVTLGLFLWWRSCWWTKLTVMSYRWVHSTSPAGGAEYTSVTWFKLKWSCLFVVVCLICLSYRVFLQVNCSVTSVRINYVRYNFET